VKTPVACDGILFDEGLVAGFVFDELSGLTHDCHKIDFILRVEVVKLCVQSARVGDNVLRFEIIEHYSCNIHTADIAMATICFLKPSVHKERDCIFRVIS